MNWLSKVAIPLVCLLWLCGSVAFWPLDRDAAASQKKLADHAEQTRTRAERGDPKAQDELGSMYYYGRGVDEDYVQAARWYRKAADQGNALAQCDLGFMYLKGEGVPQDRAEADKWFRKAAAQGNARAKWALSRTLYQEKVDRFWNLGLLIAFLGVTWISAEFLLKRRWVQLCTLRKYVSLVFSATACIFLGIAFPLVLRITRPQDKLVFFFITLLPILVLAALAALLVTACWTTLRGSQSSRGWGIAALIFLLVPIGPLIYSSQPRWKEFGFSLVVGVVGLVAFSRRLAQTDDPARTLEITHNPGDGTSAVLNAMAALLSISAALWAYSWWQSWIRANDIFVPRAAWIRALVWVLVLLFVITLHELGHTVAGLALGMKLRGFVVGPFQWYIREGKWEFEFKLAKFLPGGATLVVPATVDFPRWRELIMTAGGVLANLLTAALALWTAIAGKGLALHQVRGALGLFGAWSIVAVGNLLPFRTPEFYSDGAVIYQVLSKGPWGDFHRASAIAASTLVTPLRPRDYDIQMILRAGQAITRGAPAMTLRVFAYACYLDQGRLIEAGQAFKQAASIYEQCAAQVPAELLAEFVFASAYALRDASAARLWWTQMEARKPTRFNADYWRAASALHWIEGNLKEANEAWAKSNDLAQKLPHTGAYDFDRDCCFKLRQVIDEVTMANSAQPM